MKRIAFYLGLASALVTSCSIQEEDFKTLLQDDVTYYASFEQPAEDGTRVYANEDLLLRWTADDRVSIFGKITYNQQYKFLGETGDNSGGFSKVDGTEYVTGNPIPHTVSVYPYQEGTKISENEVLSIILPAEQHYAENTFGLGANTMVSASDDNSLQYKNVGGYLVLKLYGEGVSVSSITLKGNKGEKLAGKASVTMPPDGVPAAVMDDDATCEISLVCNTPVALGSTAEESTYFWFVLPPVRFSDGFTIFITQTQGREFEKSTTKSISIERNKVSKMSPLKVLKETPTVPVPDIIDLGLPSGIKWASFNLGASKPEEVGEFYSWGELLPKTDYSWSTYKWCDGFASSLTKYNSDLSSGTVDSKRILDAEDDVAHVMYGNKWRMATVSEWNELLEKCTWTWKTKNGVKGYMVTGPNGNSVFFPITGYMDGTTLKGNTTTGYSWSATLDTESSAHGKRLSFNSTVPKMGRAGRYYGMTIRPVYGDFVSVSGISLDQSSMMLFKDVTETLSVTVTPSNASEKTVSWTSSDPAVATVDASGAVTAVSVGTATITATTMDSGHTAECRVTVFSESDVVDLGLSVKWASFNLGASKPEECGDYFAWGELAPKADYSWSTYKWCDGSATSLTKYNSDLSSGTVDSKRVLNAEDDVAQVMYGDKWRMATVSEWNELVEKCTWTWKTKNGVKGYMVTGPNGNSVFFPITGYMDGTTLKGNTTTGYSWSATLDTESSAHGKRLSFNTTAPKMGRADRHFGMTVRPVYGEYVSVASLILNQSSIMIIKSVKETLTATVMPSNASEKSVLWTSSNPDVATVDASGAVTAVSVGTATITATTMDGGYTAECRVNVIPMPQPDAVDLGLSVKWASFNLGASKPEDYGYYYAWGETKPKEKYTRETYKWCIMVGSNDYYTKYCDNSKYGYNGYTDTKTILDLEDDAANENLGRGWRMPTREECEELVNKCSWKWTSVNGTNGIIVTGPSENKIFFPAAGAYFDYVNEGSGIFNLGTYGYYWSSSLVTDDGPGEHPGLAWFLVFGSNVFKVPKDLLRCHGHTVRPVCDH